MTVIQGPWRRQYAPDYRASVANLINALRDFLAADAAVTTDLLEEQQITWEQATHASQQLQPYRDVLRELEEWDADEREAAS